MSKINQKKYIRDYLNEMREITDRYREPVTLYDKFSSDLKLMPEEEKKKLFDDLFRDMRQDPIKGEDHVHDSTVALHYAYFALEAAGCSAWAKRITKIIPIISSMDETGEAFARMRLRESKAKGGKAKVNRHKKEALEIAVKTWEKYPNASLQGLSDELYSYLRGKWKDCPASGSIREWLQYSKLSPAYDGVKNRDFSLVIS